MSDHNQHPSKPSADEPPRVLGMLAQFEGPEELIAAARAIREKGYRKVEAFSPFPVHGIDKALAARSPVLPWVVLAAGLTGCTVALLMQWYMNATEGDYAFAGYQFGISGKPFWSLPANIPVAFELTILFAAFTSFLGMIAFNGLPRFSNPLFHHKRFAKATNDGFFLLIESEDPNFSEQAVTTAFESIGGKHVERLLDVPDQPIPRPFFTIAAIVAVVALLPLAYVAFARGGHSETPRLSIWCDMDYQPKAKAQTASDLFADGRSMRLPVAGTVARGGLRLDPRLHLGLEHDDGNDAGTGEAASAAPGAAPSDEDEAESPQKPWITEFPKEIEISQRTMTRGQQRFNIHCAVCHGRAGDGDGLVAQRAFQLQELGQAPAWKPPTSLHAETIRAQPVGQIYNTVTFGKLAPGGQRIGMAGYQEHISLEDRWAIVLYVKALQRTRDAQIDHLTEQEKAALQ